VAPGDREPPHPGCADRAPGRRAGAGDPAGRRARGRLVRGPRLASWARRGAADARRCPGVRAGCEGAGLRPPFGRGAPHRGDRPGPGRAGRGLEPSSPAPRRLVQRTGDARLVRCLPHGPGACWARRRCQLPRLAAAEGPAAGDRLLVRVPGRVREAEPDRQDRAPGHAATRPPPRGRSSRSAGTRASP
jgi:hypothetical protein